MITALRIAIALALGIFGARARGLVLTALSLLLLAFAGLAMLVSGSMPILVFALCAFAGLLAALLLPRLLPRIFIALFAILELPFLRLGSEGKIGLAALIICALLALYLAVKKPDAMMRLACAGAGGLLIYGVFPDAHGRLWLVLSVLVLFAVEELVRRLAWSEYDYLHELDRERAADVDKLLRVGVVAGAAAAVAILLLPALARTLPLPLLSDRPELPPLPFRERRDALEKLSPHGGLIWPLPSEALFWDEPNLNRELFPRVDNLDALYLGLPTSGLAQLPGTDPLGRISLHKPIAAARLFHDAPSLARLRAAALATVAALHDILPLVKPGAREAELEAALKLALHAHGCGPESFPLIFASGPSASSPHGSGNLGVLEAGTLLVADIGCSIDHYASDFTRTLPVSKIFTPRQRLLYENVFAAQAAALAVCKPGETLLNDSDSDSMEHIARAVLKQRAPDGEAHMEHGLGHTVGLFVHDILLPGPLAEGNVITIEPGTYISGELGIRIEDTFVVTKTGCDRLTEGFPAEADAVEKTMLHLP